MRHLYLLRHAKSDWDDARLADHDRPLAPRGERACALVGLLLGRSTPVPALALSSSARRAIDTTEQVLAHLSPAPPLRIDPELYLASASELLGAVRAVEDAVGSLLLVGHNPGIHAFAHELVGRADADALRRLALKLPTAGLVHLRFPVSRWSELDPGGGELVRFVRPKDLAPS